MAGRVAGKKALVTGAAQGLGAAIARRLAEDGATVLLTDINESGAAIQADAINAAVDSEVAFACRHDVTSEDDWQAAVEMAARKLHGLSVLVNNAGIGLGGTIESTSFAVWKRSFAINADGVFLGCQAALPLLKASQPASIVNISSIAGLIAAGTLTPYNASKAAVWMLTKSVALHCASQGWDIRCNSVHPAFVDTPILDNFRRSTEVPREVTMGKLAAQIPLGRLGEPEEIAAGVLYLASDESRFMTGAELKLDGGISAQ
ncbi:MAG: glucose 1-dehydrogenase [Sphingomonadales bacterium]|nr:glucose 1-dehydrogenase [Sphingomonadales bacterium]